ncbi:MAG TPA: ABC transporter ATP-binding protein [Candidatus Limnocylindrales bacterium]|jgi:energy-coupling factor transporter ATP-binding protein EcfA2|nr:ABC transporter ATP-binding protein [Candidatus Limnocylindrales bacterium]
MTTGMAPIVTIHDLRFAYPDGTVALDGVSLSAEAGSIVAVVGQNGSGKTTLAKHLNGLLRPTAGRVVVDGLDTTRHPVRRLAGHVGYVFQNPLHQLFARTVADELAFGPRNLGVAAPEVAERVATTATSLGLEPHLGAHPHRLPLPVRKLVSIASVLTMRTPILVLDEPTTGQDHRTADRIADVIRDLSAAGTTVIAVSHDMLLVAAIADRLVVLDGGRLVADGRPRDVLSDAQLAATTRLAPPQITQLAMALPGRTGRRIVLSVPELVAELRDAR